MTGIASSHHVLGVEHLRGQLWNCESAVLLTTSGRQRGKAWHEEMEAREGHHVDSQLAEISVELTWEPVTKTQTEFRNRIEIETETER